MTEYLQTDKKYVSRLHIECHTPMSRLISTEGNIMVAYDSKPPALESILRRLERYTGHAKCSAIAVEGP